MLSLQTDFLSAQKGACRAWSTTRCLEQGNDSESIAVDGFHGPPAVGPIASVSPVEIGARLEGD